eukprot:833724_1
MSLVILYLLSLLVIQSHGITCWYSNSANTVRCSTSQTCNTVDYKDFLPTGHYKVGPETTYHSGGWLNLYPVADSQVWDYHTNVASIGCRGGFGLHEGTQSLGCITVTDNAITTTTTSTQKMDECLTCYWGTCWGGINYDTVSRTIYDVTLVSQN